MRLSYDEYDEIEQEIDNIILNEPEGQFRPPTDEEADQMLENLDKDNLKTLLRWLKTEPVDEEDDDLQKYVKKRLYTPSILELYDKADEPCRMTFTQFASINQVVKNMGDNIYADEWYPTKEDIDRCIEHIDVNVVKFLVYIGKTGVKVLNDKQKSVREYAKKIVCDPEFVEIQD